MNKTLYGILGTTKVPSMPKTMGISEAEFTAVIGGVLSALKNSDFEQHDKGKVRYIHG